jgi:MerR family copper efflux transcriptional regulator
VTTSRIGEMAERSGFSESALRYYLGVGLVEPSTRTTAGYGLYHDQTVARLTFIARAKQLGCALEEITDLVGLWDGERCGPAHKRFHGLVTTRLADAERQIGEPAALAEQLRHAAAELAGPAIDGVVVVRRCRSSRAVRDASPRGGRRPDPSSPTVLTRRSA